MSSTATTILIIALVVLVGIPAGIALVVYLVVPVTKGLMWLVVHIAKFVGKEIADLLRVVGFVCMSVVLALLALANLVLFRRSAASHYWRALNDEAMTGLAALYRVIVGNPVRLLMLTPLTEGLEQRLPRVFKNVPGVDNPSQRTGRFEGYTIVGSLPGGGSGSKLYIARPSPEKLAAWSRAGIVGVDQVVIKSFSLIDGSSLPQIVRENRALPAAKRLGLILEHEVQEDRFFYVTKFVPGDTLGGVTTRMHALAGAGGLDDGRLHEVIDYQADLLRTLHYYHQNGLWHKDVKPDNIVISNSQAHLVDFGLITPLRSSITLTTHGTEYFRDPEMVRMALRGARVHEVDGCRFDIYAAGAVLYSMIEGSFPAHGGLSRITKRCPESLRWIVRRAMADYDKRYESAEAFLADIDALGAVANPFSLRPADLPSVKSGSEGAASFARHHSSPDVDEIAGPSVDPVRAPLNAATSSSTDAPMRSGPVRALPATPRFTMRNWWSGGYAVAQDCPVWGQTGAAWAGGAAGIDAPIGGPEAVALAEARTHARDARDDAAARLDAFRQNRGGVRVGIVLLSLLALGLVALAIYAMVRTPGGMPTNPEASKGAETSTPTSAEAPSDQPAAIEVDVGEDSLPTDGFESGVVEAKRVLEFSPAPVNAQVPGVLPGPGTVPTPQPRNFVPVPGEGTSGAQRRRNIGRHIERHIGGLMGWWSYD